MCKCNSCSTCNRKPIICNPCKVNQCSGPCSPYPSCGSSCTPEFRYEECDFPSLITPLNNLIPRSGATGSVELKQTVTGRVVTLQWEPFSAQIGGNGVSYLTIQQTIPNPPEYTVWKPIIYEYKSVPRVGYFYISPNLLNIQARLYLNSDGSPTGINLGDSIRMPGTCITWTK